MECFQRGCCCSSTYLTTRYGAGDRPIDERCCICAVVLGSSGGAQGQTNTPQRLSQTHAAAEAARGYPWRHLITTQNNPVQEIFRIDVPRRPDAKPFDPAATTALADPVPQVPLDVTYALHV